jgi:hypothetical protein
MEAMMATTIKQTEAAPESYPDLPSPSPLSAAAAALDPEMIWQRIEAYVAWRWTPRAIVWTVEGPGEWCPPLTPATIATVEVWSRAGEWEAATLTPSPLGGYCLPCTGPYRFTGEGGGGSPLPDVPAIVIEAFRRLAEYAAARPGKPGATEESISIGGGSLSKSVRRSASWMARAMDNSGAGDLLRAFRRA